MVVTVATLINGFGVGGNAMDPTARTQLAEAPTARDAGRAGVQLAKLY